jgi:plastocyanin
MKHFRSTMPIAVLLALGLLAAAGCQPSAKTDGKSEDFAPYTDTSTAEPETEPVEPNPQPNQGTGEDFAETHENAVLLQDNQFVPDTIEVDGGVTVTFFNADGVAHDITVGDEVLGRVEHGQALTWAAADSGTYEMICTIHPDMRGEITVR